MGFSKKKQKSWRKSQKRVGDKAKAKAKKANVIETSKKRKESKRKAVILSGKADPDGSGGNKPRAALSELESVDALFAHLEEGGDVADDSASSAGAFHDVEEDDGDEADIIETDGVPVGEAEETNINLDAEHVAELRTLKEKDPEFYNFLLNEDKALLDFSAVDRGKPENEKDEEEASDDAEEAALPQQGRTLTAERWKRIQGVAGSTFTACKAALNAYHTAVRSIEAGSGASRVQKAATSTGAKSRGQTKRERNAMLHIDDEEVFSQVLEWMVPNFVTCITQHAGKLRSSGGQRKSRFGSAFAGGVVVDPQRYARWLRVRTVASIFWTDTLFLLSRLRAQQMIEFVLRTCSTPQALSWLWPFKGLRLRFFRKCCNLWSTAPSHSVRLLAFLFLRNSVAMELEVPDPRASSEEMPRPEMLTRMTLRSFFEVAAWGYSWRNLSTFRFMENALVEMLRLDDATTYRVAYAYVRQLALVLRKACIPVEKKGGDTAAKKKKPKEDTRDRNQRKQGTHKLDPDNQEGKKKDMAKQLKDRGRRKGGQEQVLVSWPFVRAMYMWTKAISELPSLRPLAYPFFMIVTGALKTKATHLQQFPFVYHCIWCLNELSYSLDAFVPISSHVLMVLGTLIQAMTKARRVRALKGQTLEKARAPELEVLLHFSEGQTTDQMTLEVVGGSLCFLLTTHMGLLSQSPSFPEISAPVVVHLRKHSKHCPSESLRHQLKTLLTTMETSANDVRARRDALTEAPASDKFLIFEADTALAKARAVALQRKATQEKGRVEAELTADRKAAAESAKKKKTKGRKAEDYVGEDTEDEGARDEEEAKPHKPRKKRRRVADAPDVPGRPTLTGEAVLAAMEAAGATKEDLVEEEGFSSDDE